MQLIRPVNLKQLVKKVLFRSFFPPTSKQIKFTDKFQTSFKQDGKLQPMKDVSAIKDFDDKFGIAEIRDTKIILNHLKDVKFSYSLNDTIYFLKHFTKLVEENVILKKELKNQQLFQELIASIKKSLQSQQLERYPNIGSLAYCLNILDVRDNELWLALEQKIDEDRYYTNFKEAVFAVQGFTHMKTMKSIPNMRERIDTVYKNLERIVQLTIWEVDPIHYYKIANGIHDLKIIALAEVERFDPEMWQKLEQHILTNMSLDYETSTMVGILLAFSKAKQGSAEFYDAMQYVIFKGHMWNRNQFFKSQVQIQYNAKVVSGLMQVFKEVSLRKPDFQFHPEFQSLIHKMIVNPKTEYDVESGTNTLRHLSIFNFEDMPQIVLHVLGNIYSHNGNISMKELLDFHKYIEYEFDVERFGIPFEIFRKLQGYLMTHLEYYEDHELQQFFTYMIQRPKFIIDRGKFTDAYLTHVESKLTELTPVTIQEAKQLLDQVQIQNQLTSTSIEQINLYKLIVEGEQLERFKSVIKRMNDVEVILRFKQIK